MNTTASLQAIWDDSHRNIPTDKDFSRYAEDQLSHLGPNSNICDLGGGAGVDSSLFAQQGHKVTIYDISPLALERAKNHSIDLGLELNIVQSDFGSDQFALPVDTFDFVYSRLALHYFPSVQLARILATVYASLKDGGKAKITLKSPVDAREMNYIKSNAEESEPGVFIQEGQIKTRFSLTQLNSILEKSGIPESSYSIGEITEDLSGRVDTIKSGNKVMSLNEITITK